MSQLGNNYMFLAIMAFKEIFTFIFTVSHWIYFLLKAALKLLHIKVAGVEIPTHGEPRVHRMYINMYGS